MVPFAGKYDFNLLLPEFRGINLDTNPHPTLACASLHAKQDIKDAVDYLVEHTDVDNDNILLLGCSGGEHELDHEAAARWLLSQYKKQEMTAVTGRRLLRKRQERIPTFFLSLIPNFFKKVLTFPSGDTL